MSLRVCESQSLCVSVSEFVSLRVFHSHKGNTDSDSVCVTIIKQPTALQVKELKLHDKWAESCVPSGGAVVNPDPLGRRNGQGGLRV